METVAAIIGSFLLFLVVFPLIGAGAGLILRILVPYLCGGGVIYLLMKRVLSPSGAWWELAVPLVAWGALVLGTRFIDSHRQEWHEGHWRAVMIVVTFGLWRKAQLPVPFIEEPELSPAGNN